MNNTCTIGALRSCRIWILAARPKTLPASLVPVFVGTSISLQSVPFRFLPIAAIFLAALLIQVATNYANDVFDFEKGADDPTRVGPLRVTQAGLISPKKMKLATAMVILAAALVGTYLVCIGGLPILIIGVISLSCAVLYTAGPLPIAYCGAADVFVLLFFGPVAVGGTYYILTGGINPAVIYSGTAVGMISTALLVVNNLRDIAGDKKIGKKTLAVRFGPQFARVEYTLLIVGAGLLPIHMHILFNTPLPTLLAVLYLIPALSAIRLVFGSTDGPALNHALHLTGKLLLAYGVLFGIGWLL